MHFNILIGNRLKEIRKRKKITQEALAEVVGVTAQHISNIENGKTKVSLETFIKITRTLDVSADMILVDCLNVSEVVYQEEIMSLLEDCSSEELKILTQFLESTKNILRNNRWT